MRKHSRRRLTFVRGRHMFQIATVYNEDEEGFIGIQDGRIVARGKDSSVVARALILGGG